MIYILRILSLPGFIILQVVYLAWGVIARSWRWVRYGGEAFNYNPLDRPSIYKIYKELKDGEEIEG